MEKKFGPMMQMAFVVDDFDAPIEFWTKKMNIGPFFKLEHLNVKDVYYMNKPTNLDFSVAIAYTGSMQIFHHPEFYHLADSYNLEILIFLHHYQSHQSVYISDEVVLFHY